MGKTGTILVVDDEKHVLELARDMLRFLGHEVETCPNGTSAVEAFRNNNENIDVVILDMSMPDMNGTQVFKELKAINPDVKAIISSGYGHEDDFEDAFAAGVCGLVQKPYTMEKMAGELNRLLEEKTAKRA